MIEDFTIKNEDVPGAQLQLLVNILSRLQTLEEFILTNQVRQHETEDERKKIVEKYYKTFDENFKQVSSKIYQQFAKVDLNEILKPPSSPPDE